MMEALQYRGDRIKLVLNRANSKVKLSLKDVEHALSKKVVMGIPSNIMVPLSVNKGIPIVLDRPRAPVARNLFQFIDILENGSHLPAIGSKS
jgi:pilus assembly protein CpaE